MTGFEFLAVVIVTVFAIVDPLGTLPFYVALTTGFTDADREVVLNRSVLAATSILVGFALVGRFLFAAFGFTLWAFEIAGGILLFTVAYDMLRGEITRTKLNPQDREEAIARRDELSIVPLAIPLLAGPGAISTVMIYGGSAGATLLAQLATIIAVLVTGVATFVIFRFGARIFNRFGQVGLMAMTRVLGLLLAAVAVQFVLDGITGFLPSL